MHITKLGHCCLVIEEAGARLMTDPGGWTTAQNEIKNLDVILITHEHPDHFHVESLKIVLKNSPQAVVITNSAVGALLDNAGIAYRGLEHDQAETIKGVSVEGHGQNHAVIHPEVPSVMNTGYRIAEKLFYPGDALYVPNVPVEVLALPVAGPWLKISEAIDYALSLKPRLCFPVHDGMLSIIGPFHGVPSLILPKHGIEFTPLTAGQELEV